MGKKIVALYCTLCVISFVLMSVSCFNKWHQVTFKTLGFKTVFRLETSLLVATVPKQSKLFCGVFTKWQPKRCLAFDEGIPLQEAASDWCAPLPASIYPAPCIAFNRAYVFGLVVILMYAFNVILLCTSSFMLYQYLDSKTHKPEYRHWAGILHGIGVFLILIAVVGYSVFAVTAMDSIGGSGIPGLFEASQSVGVSPGFFMVWLGILFQLVALGMHGCMKLSNEQTEEQRAYKDMLKEQAAYGAMEEQAASFQSQYQEQGYGYDASYDPAYAGHQGSFQGSFQSQPGFTGPAMPPQAAPAPQPAGMPQGTPGQAAW